MPGSTLSRTEQDLLKWWEERPQVAGGPNLTSLSVKGDPGLRGIRNLTVDFEYPLAVISGPNGSGKSTILALAALAFHSPEGHIPINAQRRPKPGENYSYYTFRDFFYRGPGDPNLTGIEIRWQYSDQGELVIHKQSEKWMHYDRRPKRPVHYLGIIRSLPAIEQTVLRGHFSAQKAPRQSSKLNDEFRRRLGEVMGRPYTEAVEMRAAKNYTVRQVNSASIYSSFNMGAGEDILIDLFLVLQECPKNSLIVIEEVELGLHPEALRRLAEHLQAIMLEKRLQVILSTHSEHFIDAVPRAARILVQHLGKMHVVTPKPTTRMAVSQLSGLPQSEISIFCEDVFAAELIRSALTDELRRRSSIIPVGSDSELVAFVWFRAVTEASGRALVVWDGDVSETKIAGWVKKLLGSKNLEELPGFNYIKLPGTVPPELWAVHMLDNDDGVRALASELRSQESTARGYLTQLLAQSNHHDMVHELAAASGAGDDATARRILANAVNRVASKDLSEIPAAVAKVLEGHRVPESHEELQIGLTEVAAGRDF